GGRVPVTHVPRVWPASPPDYPRVTNARHGPRTPSIERPRSVERPPVGRACRDHGHHACPQAPSHPVVNARRRGQRRAMPFAYIVECSDGTYYAGSTWNLERRIGEHNEGLGAEYTKRRRPVRLVWSVQLNRIDEAFRVEKQIQGWGRAKRLALIEGRYDDLPGLARTAKPSG